MKVNPKELRTVSELTEVIASAFENIVDLCDDEIGKARDIIATERSKDYPAEWRIEDAHRYIVVYEKIKSDIETHEIDISDILQW
jgi:hypothetical protein